MPNESESNRFDKQATLLVLMCVLYNPILAIVNGNFFVISRTTVVAAEILLLCSLFVIIVQQGFRRSDRYPLIILGVYVLSSLTSTMLNGFFFVDAIRNIMIVSLLTMIGVRLGRHSFHKIFMIVALCVAAFLLIEIIAIEKYAKLFQPALYYANTRGGEISDFNELGIFGAALGFEGRFSFGVFSGPRTSSVFLEQVSLGNFASVFSIYLMCFWNSISKHRKYFYVILVIVVLLSTVSRTGSVISAIMLLGYRFFPRLPKYGYIAIVPGMILCSAIILALTTGSYDDYGDTLLGRIVLGMGHLFSLDFADYLGFGAAKLNFLWDSGFAYLFASSTIFGFLALWFFMLFFIPQTSERARRCAWGINIYFFLTIVVSGNSVYSIKTASLLWLMAGYVYSCKKIDRETSDPVFFNDNVKVFQQNST